MSFLAISNGSLIWAPDKLDGPARDMAGFEGYRMAFSQDEK
uniref:Uncharacterized protein n=1 Tax=Candidatus Nitrotoga fabula TaxID=2182327 RepID=A0A2X0SH99_9PROT|nr:protein of unknown function [Candidatus Nitrotoga fabula]